MGAASSSQSLKPKLVQVKKQEQEKKQSPERRVQNLLDVVFSWSLSDVLNKDLYKHQVEELPLTFSSTSHYMQSFINLILEETHADLLSQVTGICQAPASPISCRQRISSPNRKELLYRITLTGTRYEAKVGDLIALTQVKPTCINDLDRPNSPYLIAFVQRLVDQRSIIVQVRLSEVIQAGPIDTKERSEAFVVYLTNLTTNMRIWQALNLEGNMSIIQRTLSFSSPVANNCVQCCCKREKGVIDIKVTQAFDSFALDSSQEAAVLSCLAAQQCSHQNCTKLIWGPPGTGKTKTVASLLFVLLRTKCRTLTCAPTNIAVLGVVTRLMVLLRGHDLGCDTYGLGDIVLFGNKERMKIADHDKLYNVFLDFRIDALSNCLWQWKSLLNDMIRFLEDPMKEYHHFCRRFQEPSTSAVTKPEKTVIKSKKMNKKREHKPNKTLQENQWTFEEFSMNRFDDLGKKLIACIKSMYTHMPTSMVPLDLAKQMVHSIDMLQKVSESVKEIVNRHESLRVAFNGSDDSSLGEVHFLKLRRYKTKCVQALKVLEAASFQVSRNRYKLRSFCLKNACLIFCTASSTTKLHMKGMTPIELLLIDEAAQLKECESVIPLKLLGLRNAVLVGDEKQLPSMVQSKICKEANFGRSLFERLVLLGHKKHLLNVQYRMHPSISRFPNIEFYDRQILDGPNVIKRAHEKHYLEGAMYGSYSFINVDFGKEEMDNNSTKNMVEVAVIAEIVANLFKECVGKKQTVSIGCISAYKAQVNAIQAKLGKNYDRDVNGSNFVVNVRSVDGFQGGEEDIIIFSTVRCNRIGLVGFLSDCQRANVALTRARYCLWIVGNRETMINSGSAWNTLVLDAESRGCIYNASDDKNLARAMMHALVELGQFYSLLKTDSILFREAKWKVIFTNTFFQRIAGVANFNVRIKVISLLVMISSGWRQSKKNKRKGPDASGISNMLEKYSINGHLYLIWSVDVVYEDSQYVQVLKFWDTLRLSQMQQRTQNLERVFGSYTLDMINRCQAKRVERNQVLPMTWMVDSRDDTTLSLASQLAKLGLVDSWQDPTRSLSSRTETGGFET